MVMINRKEIQQVEQEQTGNRTILLVEDDDAVAELLIQVIMQETPYHVLAVTDGPQAFDVIRDVLPHLLILDYRLPSINGIELYDQIRATQGLEVVPAIMLAANIPFQEIVQRKIPYLKKPFEIDRLLALIEQSLA
jgi:CheY-like chemotaxis protein